MGRNLLILGARAPIAADLARVLVREGHSVWAADSLRHPVGRHVPGLSGYVRLRAPREDFEGFRSDLADACRRLGIETVIPVSEEVFWLSLAASVLPPSVALRSSGIDVLARLHDKARFAKLAADLGFGAQENRVIRSRHELDQIEEPSAWVFKPVYSRFASRVLLRPSRSRLLSLKPSASDPWLAQTFEEGRELCCYNLAEQGRLLLHVAYAPKFRFGVGASLYFDPVESGAVFEMSRRFVEATHFTGQISFDAIEARDRLVALECNPRGTSGVHLAVQSSRDFAGAILGHGSSATGPLRTSPRMLKLPLLLSHPLASFSRDSRSLLRVAKDAMGEAGIGFLPQGQALFEILGQALAARVSLRECTTRDIEWNGEGLSEVRYD